MSHADSVPTTRLVRTLARYSIPIYVIGLAITASPTILERFLGIELATSVRFIVVWGAIGVMALTYAAERRMASGRGDSEYSLYTRISIAMALFGVAIGIYVAVGLDRPIVGALFVLGAYMFVRMGYRQREIEQEGSAEGS